MMIATCPCASGFCYMNCCGRFIISQQLPNTMEELMRSRYTAYVLHNIDYIANTMCDKATLGFSKKDTKHFLKLIQYTKLKVLHVLHDSTNDNHGYVEFMAYYIANSQMQILHEISEFKRKNGKWFYVDGIIK